MTLQVLDLFSGIGGFSLGLERAGMTTAAFCEIEPFCRAVLAKHWPGVPIYDDVRTLTGERLAADGISVDVICGGFPCQDISLAGRGAGLSGERSGLWFEYRRVIEEVAPRWVIIENVPALRTRGLDVVLGGLAEIGYDAEWHLIPASAIGAPHQRDRVWILAYSAFGGWREHGHERGQACDTGAGQPTDCGSDVAYRDGVRCEPLPVRQFHDPKHHTEPCREDVANAGRAGLPGAECAGWGEPVVSASDIRRAASECRWGRAAPGLGGEADGVRRWVDGTRPLEPWEGNTPRTVGRGFPNRRPRLKALGNSVVPQIPELIGRAILQAEARHAA
jgi:DNA (cytosine-5)-methyltransferase 1